MLSRWYLVPAGLAKIYPGDSPHCFSGCGQMEDMFPRHLRTLMFFIFTAAKITIARAWESPVISVTLVKHKISWIIINEKLTSILIVKQSKCEKAWNPWIQYLQAPLGAGAPCGLRPGLGGPLIALLPPFFFLSLSSIFFPTYMDAYGGSVELPSLLIT